MTVIFPVLGCFTMHRLTSESSKENQLDIRSLSDQHAGTVLSKNDRKKEERMGVI